MKWLNGKKGYLGSIAAGLVGILWTQGWISNELAGVIGSVITMWTGVAFRSAISKGR